jgi:hypothetical protein
VDSFETDLEIGGPAGPPGRTLVLRLAESLELTLRERNGPRFGLPIPSPAGYGLRATPQ